MLVQHFSMIRKMLCSPPPYLLPFFLTIVSIAVTSHAYAVHDCSEFQEASCLLTSDNIVDYDNKLSDVAVCQSRSATIINC